MLGRRQRENVSFGFRRSCFWLNCRLFFFLAIAVGFSLDTERTPDDLIIEKGEVRVVIDTMSMDFLRGAQVDYVDELVGSAFRISNPNAQSSCGCGSSFAI